MRSGPKGRLTACLLAASIAVTGCGTDTTPTTNPTTAPVPPPSSSTTTTTTSIPEPAEPEAARFDAFVLPASEALLSSSWRQGCPVGPEDLRLLVVTHWDFSGRIRTGELVVHHDVAEDIVSVFATLYEEQFPLERVEMVQFYGSDDNRSMAANNTSAFNCRTVAGTDSWSEHAYGRAIDINPVQNPYVGSDVSPPAGAAFVDRSDVRPGMVTPDGVVVRAFASVGWQWGGEWSRPDYQHFSQSGR